jgi:hypothetical protein
MQTLRRRFAVTAFAGGLAIGGFGVGTAAPASASTDCPNSTYEVVSSNTPHIVHWFNEEGRTTSLQWKYNRALIPTAYAYIGGSVKPGDRVWFDYSVTAGDSWEQCGPFVSTHTTGFRTKAYLTSPLSNVKMRACSRLAGDQHRSKCTDWW